MKIIETNNARQGRWGLRVLAILIIALFLSLIAWSLAEYVSPRTDEAEQQEMVE